MVGRGRGKGGVGGMTDDAVSDKKDGSDIALAVKPRRVLMRVENASFGLRKGGASNIW